MTTYNNVVLCQACGGVIGNYVNGQDGRVMIRVGTVTLRDAWGWCGCGEQWIFHSSDKQLEKLIEKLQKPIDIQFAS